MSKRPMKPLGFGGGVSKIAKLEVTISEHNFPLSQNVQQRSSPRDCAPADVWGDDNEDDLLLQASQACEQNNLSAVPDYSIWQQAPSSSTQLYTPIHNKEVCKNHKQQKDDFPISSSNSKQTNQITENKTNKETKPFKTPLSLKLNSLSQHNTQNAGFKFKAPSANLKPSNMKDCNGIESPFHEISGNVKENAVDDSFVMDNMRGDTEHFYRRLLQVQEENAKLKSENGKLLEQALSKDGEVTILRGRLKSSQAAVDSARLEKLQASERLQMEWSEKLGAVNKEVGSLRTQLDCKELEVVRMRERCRMLESNKVKLSQVPSSQLNSTHLSQRQANNNYTIQHDMNGIFLAPGRRKQTSVGAQTEKVNTSLKLNTAYRTTTTNLSRILPLLLEPETDQQSIFQDLGSDYSNSKYRSFGTDNRDEVPRTSDRRKKLNLSAVYEEMSVLATVRDWNCIEESVLQKCLNILTQVKNFLTETLMELERASAKVTTAFQRDLDDKYVKQLAKCAPVDVHQLFSGKALFKEEQKVTARRGTAALATLCTLCSPLQRVVQDTGGDGIMCVVEKIISQISAVSCAVQYSGLLLSFVYLIKCVLSRTISDDDHRKISSVTRDIVLSRPSPQVICAVLPVVKMLAIRESGLCDFCTSSPSGNLKFDFDQGLVMYKRETCFLQVLLSQLETCYKCLEREGQASSAVSLARDLLSLYRNAETMQVCWCRLDMESRCKCSLRLAQVIVYMLQVCARLLNSGIVDKPTGSRLREDLLAVCRCGIAIVYLWTLRETDLRSLDLYTGRCHSFVDLCHEMRQHVVLDEIQDQVLTELRATLQPSSEDLEPPPDSSKQIWIDSFSRFHVTD